MHFFLISVCIYVLQIHGENTGDFFDTYAAAYISQAETNRTVFISVCDDDIPEADETFIFYLTLQVGITFSTLHIYIHTHTW